jgi:hypothetical protein
VAPGPLGAVIGATAIRRRVRVRAKPSRWMGDRADRRVPGGKKRFRGASPSFDAPLT